MLFCQKNSNKEEVCNYFKELKEIMTMLEANCDDNFICSLITEYNQYNKNDSYLDEISKKAGKTCKPLYLYGLYDRIEFEIRCSHDVYDILLLAELIDEEDLLQTPKGKVKVVKESGERRIGISYNLREKHMDFCINLVKKITNM